MPNYVYHKIIFNVDKFSEVIPKVIDKYNYVNFKILVPQPPNMYHGNLGAEEEKDFKINWLSWNMTNWGTKWNACSSDGGTYGIMRDGQRAWIQFETAWSVAYPWIAAFLNATQMPFELYYLDEGENFWGYEKYGLGKFSECISRIEKRRDNKDDLKLLYTMFNRETFEEDEE